MQVRAANVCEDAARGLLESGHIFDGHVPAEWRDEFMTTQYSTNVVEGMQALYGKGFLSPGGAEEMAVLLDGLDLSGRTVLDIGCGLGGAAVMLAGTFDARHVTSIDVAGDLVMRAREAIREAGLAGKIETHHVTPGPLPFDDAAFDTVFAKDVVCHIPDKPALFDEVARVLVPGGRVICADFTVPSGPEAAPHLYNAWIDAMKAYGLTFHFEELAVYEEAFRRAGLGPLCVKDDTVRSLDAARREVAWVRGPEAGILREALGEEMFARRIDASMRRLDALAGDGIHHTHMLARRLTNAD